jgi:hypothetical protein
MTAVYIETDRASEVTLQDLYYQMALLLDRLDYGLLTDSGKRLKINLVDSGALAAVTTVTTVSSVSGVANQLRMGDVQAQRVVEALMDTAYQNGILRNITF